MTRRLRSEWKGRRPFASDVYDPPISSAWWDVNLYYLALFDLLLTELVCVMSHLKTPVGDFVNDGAKYVAHVTCETFKVELRFIFISDKNSVFGVYFDFCTYLVKCIFINTKSRNLGGVFFFL